MRSSSKSSKRLLSLRRLPLQAAAVVALTAATFGIQAQMKQSDPNAPGSNAATPADTTASLFKRIDANGDGKITREEAARVPALASRFDQLDKDKDGQLTVDEFSVAVAPSKQEK